MGLKLLIKQITMEKESKLAVAVLQVMAEVEGIEKSMQVGTGTMSYKGVPDQEVKKIIGKAMRNAGLVILPIGVTPLTKVDRWEEENTYNGQVTKKTKQSVFTEVATRYKLLHKSGEFEILEGYGHGVDSQDKSAGKATTYALKYTLLYSFLVPTGKIDDADTTHSEEIDTPQTTAKEDNNLPWLNENTVEWAKVVEALKGEFTMAQVRKKYKVSKPNEAKLLEQAK